MLEPRMPEVDSQSKAQPAPPGDAPDPLAGLYHMSNTAGLSTQDYVAINPVAIWSVFFGVASVLVVLSNVLLAIPLVGLGCAVIALIQIRSSNGTQTGKGLATVGLALSLALGGGKLGYVIYNSMRISADEEKIGQEMHDLGQDILQNRYDAAYGMFEDVFTQRVSRAEFERGFKTFNNIPELGRLESIEWNHQPIAMEERPDAGITDAYAMSYFRYANSSEPRRVVIAFQKKDGVWRPAAIESIFPMKKK